MWAVAGSEHRTIELYRLLAPHADVKVWSAYTPDPSIAAQVPIERIEPARFRFPRGGTAVFVGVYFRYGRWVHLSGCTRRIIVYNSDHPHILRRRIRKLQSFGTHRVEVVFASRWLRDACPYRGPVHVSPIDIRRFSPRPTPRPPGPFMVGRLSRNQPEKHNRRDPAIYNALVSGGMRVRIMGGELLRELGPLDERVELVPEGGQEAWRFVQDLDCLFYRTSDEWQEPHGRVVQEAMACGLPVVCSRRVGATDFIRHGRNGFVFDSDAEALEILRGLRDDPMLAARVGAAARRTVEVLFSEESVRRVRDFYLRGTDTVFDPASELDVLLAAGEGASAHAGAMGT
jgi:glycosyltransferase involved in cell wall biosynthesis